MNLSPAETTIIDILRDEAGPVFTVSITKTVAGVTVIVATPADGVHAAAGVSFEAALYALCGVVPAAERPLDDEPSPSQH